MLLCRTMVIDAFPRTQAEPDALQHQSHLGGGTSFVPNLQKS